MSMKRSAEDFLDQWKIRSDRKPLILRGARQVGKSYLIKAWGAENFETVIHIDLEREAIWFKSLKSKDPKAIIQEISLLKNQKIVPGSSLLFFDEVQACPELLPALRYFYENLPSLHVIAAGSLLDFALADISEPMPVGRIEYLYLHPLSFGEFVQAAHSEELSNILSGIRPPQQISSTTHQMLLGLLREYYFVGGMPEAVAIYLQNRDLLDVQRVQSNILATMQDDFSKYNTRLDPQVLRTVFTYAVQNPARRSKFVDVAREFRSQQLKLAFRLLEMARIVHLVRWSAGNGVPLAAEQKEDRFKPIFLDIGLSNRACQVPLIADLTQLLTVRAGALAEQFVGQELLHSFQPFEDGKLYYWQREALNSSAEIDFLSESAGQVIPIEVKAARGNTLRSLHSFIREKKKVKLALRLSTREMATESLKVTGSPELSCQLISLPLYMAAQSRSLT